MWTPNSIEELLDERIEFCQNYINSRGRATGNGETVTDFIVGLADFKYCKRLFETVKENPSDDYSKAKFKKLAIKVIMDIHNQMELQDHKVICLHGAVLPLREKEQLPQENKDNSEKLTTQLEKIFQEVNNM